MRKIILFVALAGLIALPTWAVNVKSNMTSSDGWLGVYTQTVDKDLKEAFKLESDHGVVVTNVVPDSPADQAGLKSGDIILSFGGQDLTSADQLAELVSKHESGEKVHLTVLHKGHEKDIVATIRSREDNNLTGNYLGQMGNPNTITKSFVYKNSEFQDTYIGVSLQNLSSQLGDYFGVKDGKGALVTDVMDNSPAQKAGLKAGDVIVSIDGKDVEGPSDVRKAVGEKSKGEMLNIGVMRDHKTTELAVQVEETPQDFFSAPQGTMPPGIDNFNLPNMPAMKWLYKGDYDENLPDMKEMQQEMKQLQDQMKQLQKEIQNLHQGQGDKE